MKYRVLHLIPSLSGGGAERQLGILSARLHEHLFENHIGYLKEGINYSSMYFEGSVLHRIDASSNYSPAIFGKVCQLVGKVKPDVVHTWIVQMDVLGGYASSIMGVPWVLREPNCRNAYGNGWKHSLRAAIARNSSGIVANSQQGLDYWREKLVAVHMTVIGNGFEIDRIDAVQICDKRKHNLEKASKTVLFAGRFEYHKNVNRLLAAFETVRRDLDSQLIFCGDGPLRRDVEKRAGSALGKTIIMPGTLPSDELWGLMKAVDILCLVSTREGMPNVIVEAGLCGVPLVVSDIPAHREILDESLAIFVDPQRTESIARGIKEALEDKVAASHRAVAARKHFEQFSVDAMVKKYVGLYKEVIEKHKQRPRVGRD